MSHFQRDIDRFACPPPTSCPNTVHGYRRVCVQIQESLNTVRGLITNAMYGNAVGHPAVLDVFACASKAGVQDNYEWTELLTGGLHLSHLGSRCIICKLRQKSSRVFRISCYHQPGFPLTLFLVWRCVTLYRKPRLYLSAIQSEDNNYNVIRRLLHLISPPSTPAVFSTQDVLRSTVATKSEAKNTALASRNRGRRG